MINLWIAQYKNKHFPPWVETNTAKSLRNRILLLATAPHSTKDMILFITNPDWQLDQPIKWSDMQEFCRFGEVPLAQDENNRDVYNMTCDLPERIGRHVIFNIWQRSDSPEAYYACSDVVFADDGMPPANDGEICVPITDSNNNMTVICF